MNVIRPNAMTTAQLVSTTAVEQWPTWAAGTTYAAGNRVVHDLSIFQSLSASNIGQNPDTSPLAWVRIGPSNRWAMFDQEVQTQTIGAGVLTAVFSTGGIDALFIGNALAASVTVTVRDGLGGAIVYQQTQTMAGLVVGNWFEYFYFDPFVLRTQAVFADIPPVPAAHVTLALDGGGATAACGIVSFGRVYHVGSTASGARAGMIDFSRKTTDDFGTTTFVRRGFSKRMSANVLIEHGHVNRVQRLLYDLRATPAVWIANDGEAQIEEPLIQFGFVRDFGTDITYAHLTHCNLEIEGLI